MEASQTHTNTGHHQQPLSIRDEIALALDGVLPTDGLELDAAYSAAMTHISAAMEQQVQRIRQLGSAGLIAAPARNGLVQRLLRTFGVTPISTSAIPESHVWPGIVFIGCLAGAAHNGWMERMLERGAVIVSSDRTAGMPVVSRLLNVTEVRPARRARIAINPNIADVLAEYGEWGRLVAELNPAVRLAPGHLSLAIEQHAGTRVIARDALTDEPLVVSARVGEGCLIHSVAHWWQDAQPDSTEFGQRSLASVPPFSALGLEHRAARLGGFSAASALLACLLTGLAPELDRPRHRSSNRETPAFDDGREAGADGSSS